MGLCKLCSLSPPNYSPFLLFSSFLPSLPNFHSSLSLSVFSHPVQALFTKSLLKPGKKAQQQQLATLFSRAGIEGLGALCMSEPHSSGSIQLRFCLRYSPRPYTLSGAREHREKRRDRPFLFLCTPHSYASVPKASANESASEWREREAGLRKRKGLINTGSFSSRMERQS